MKNFEYFSPKTIEDALRLLFKYKEECKIIAGGQSLLVPMKLGLVAPTYLIDVKGISSLDYLEVDQRVLRIGALTTHRKLETSNLLGERLSVLVETEHHIASVETRNWGTVGGNVAHADPAGDLMPVLIALDASMEIIGPKGKRTVKAEEFPKGYLESDLAHDEILKEIRVPFTEKRTAVVFEKFKIVEEDYATVSAAVFIRLHRKKEVCEEVRVALGNVTSTAVRARKAESILQGKALSDELFSTAGNTASQEVNPIGDMHASEEYKRNLVKVFVERVGKAAFENAKTS